MIFQMDMYMMIYLIIFLVIFICCCCNIIICVWVYKDAEKRNMNDPAIWLAVVLLGGCVGCIVYLIVRDPLPSSNQDQETSYHTPQSNDEPSFDIIYCPSCGAKLDSSVKFCGKCGNEIE